MDKQNINNNSEETPEIKMEEEISINTDQPTLDESERKIALLELQVKELKDQVLRGLADSENLRKRLTKEIQDAGKFAVSNLAKDMTSVLENLYRATAHLTPELLENEQVDKIVQGVDMTRNEFTNVLEKFGIKRISPQIGEKFDHNFHQAISQQQDPNYPNESIIAVVQAGYVLHDRLLQPAMVVVSRT